MEPRDAKVEEKEGPQDVPQDGGLHILLLSVENEFLPCLEEKNFLRSMQEAGMVYRCYIIKGIPFLTF